MNINQNESDKDIILSNNSKVAKYSSESFKKGLNLATKIENIDLNNQYKYWFNEGIHGLREYRKALVSFDKALKINPENADCWYWHGKTLFELIYLEKDLTSIYKFYEPVPYKRELEKALVSFDKALKINPENPDYWYWQGKTLSELIYLEKALFSFDKALNINPENGDYWWWKGNTLCTLEEFEKALISFDKALKINPNIDYGWDGWHAYSVASYYSKEYKKSLIAINKILKIKPDHDCFWFFQGLTLCDLREYEKALISFRKALKINSDNADYWYWQGKTLYDLERYQEALTCLEQALKIDPEHDLAKTLLHQLNQELLL